MEGSAGLSNGKTEWDFSLPPRGKEASKNYELDLGDRILRTTPEKTGCIPQTIALTKLLNRSRLQAACFNHKTVTIVHVLSAATLTPEAFDVLASMGVSRAALAAACLQLMSSLEAEVEATHPALIPFDRAVEEVLISAERRARSPIEPEKQVLGVRDLLAESVEQCKQDVRLQQLLSAQLAPTVAEETREEVQRLSESLSEIRALIAPAESITTPDGEDVVQSLADWLRAQSARLQRIEDRLPLQQATEEDVPVSTWQRAATFAALVAGGMVTGLVAAKFYPALAHVVSRLTGLLA